MKHTLWIVLVGCLMLASQAYASSMSIFTVKGNAPKGTDIEAQWKGETMADSEADHGKFELDIPMGRALPYHKGDKLKLVVNGKAEGKIEIGKPGASTHITLP